MRGLFTLRGRTDRMAFARFAAVAALAAVPFRIALDLAIHAVDASFPLKHVPAALRSVTLPGGIATAVIVLGVAGVLCLAIVALAFLVRRFHDMGLSGWLVLPAFAVSALVSEIETPVESLPPLGTLVWMILMALVPGTVGPNRYGPSAAAAGSGPGAGIAPADALGPRD